MKKFLQVGLPVILLFLIFIQAFPMLSNTNSTLSSYPILDNRGVSDLRSKLFSEKVKFTSSHSVDDTAAIEGNLLYMFVHDKQEIHLFMPSVGHAGLQSFIDAYIDVATCYPEFGFGLVEGRQVNNNVILRFSGYPISDSDLQSRTDIAIEVASQVHDEMWNKGLVTSDMSQQEIARVYYDWVVDNCEYDFEAQDAHPVSGEWPDIDPAYINSYMAYGVFINKKAIATGYTAAYNMLLRMEGIDCIAAISSSDKQHMLTEATLDGSVYHLDPMFADTSGQHDKYFCMTLEESWPSSD